MYIRVLVLVVYLSFTIRDTFVVIINVRITLT